MSGTWPWCGWGREIVARVESHRGGGEGVGSGSIGLYLKGVPADFLLSPGIGWPWEKQSSLPESSEITGNKKAWLICSPTAATGLQNTLEWNESSWKSQSERGGSSRDLMWPRTGQSLLGDIVSTGRFWWWGGCDASVSRTKMVDYCHYTSYLGMLQVQAWPVIFLWAIGKERASGAEWLRRTEGCASWWLVLQHALKDQILARHHEVVMNIFYLSVSVVRGGG